MVPVFFGHVFDARCFVVRQHKARIIDQHIGRPQCSANACERGTHLIGSTDIGGDGNRPVAQFLSRTPGAGFVQIDDGDAGALFCESVCNRETDALRCAGHGNDFFFQFRITCHL